MSIYNQLVKNNNKYKIALIDPDKKNEESLKEQINYAHLNDYYILLYLTYHISEHVHNQ